MISHQKWVCVFKKKKKLYLHVFPQPFSRLCTTNVTPMGVLSPTRALTWEPKVINFCQQGLWAVTHHDLFYHMKIYICIYF